MVGQRLWPYRYLKMARQHIFVVPLFVCYKLENTFNPFKRVGPIPTPPNLPILTSYLLNRGDATGYRNAEDATLL